MSRRPLQVFAGARARQRLAEAGLQPGDVRVVPAAAGGPKGLVLLPLDRVLFGDWLPRGGRTVHLVGASIGAWRLATACLGEPAAFAELAEDYIHQRYDHAPGRPPSAAQVSQAFAAKLRQRFGGRAGQVLAHPRYRLHVVTSHGRGLLGRPGRWRTPLGFAGAFAANAVRRRWLGGWLERVLFSDPRDPWPLPLRDLRSRSVGLTAQNLCASLLASCSIPFWLEPVCDIPGAPAGPHWDGGLTDYHLHLDYAALAGAHDLVLYPHFQRQLVPGWLDKPWQRRHATTPALDNVVVLAPHPDWVAGLPGGKLPDRSDFQRHLDDDAARIAAWTQAHRAAQQLADAFTDLAQAGRIDAAPL